MRLPGLILCCAMFAAPVAAHDAWFEPAPGGMAVRFGHESAVAYDPAKLRQAMAFDAAGRPADVARAVVNGEVHLRFGPEVAVLAIEFDNGYWSKGPDGRSVNRPRTENPGATGGSHALKYSKRILRWSDAASRPLGRGYEIVPLARPRAGEALAVRVLRDGAPVDGVPVGTGEDDASVRTDAQGLARVPVQRGPNRLWSGTRTPVQGEPRYDVRSESALLAFDAE